MNHYLSVKGQYIQLSVCISKEFIFSLWPVVAMAACGYYKVFLLLICCTYSVISVPTLYLEMNTPSKQEIEFLQKYGYMEEPSAADGDSTYTSQSIAEAVIKMQAFAGLPKTGELDPETKKLFTSKRCGVKDIHSDPDDTPRRRRYIIQSGWSKRSITYKVKNGASTLGKSNVEHEMERGLAVWAPYGKLTFSKVDEGEADIKVKFAAKDHGDGFPFDDRGHVVAHAFAPPYGAMHFDDDELWTDDPNIEDEDATDFFAVAVHEIGHALGLRHSDVKDSVMYPYYQAPVEKLHSDDIKGMQELYLNGEEVEEEKDTERPVLPRTSFVPFTKADSEEFDEDDIPDLCFTNYDTITVIQGKIYVFEEEWMWVLRDRKQIEEGYPKRFHDVFVGLPERVTIIRTIYEKRNKNIVIFSEQDYWEFDQNFHFVKNGKLKDFLIPDQIPELQTVFVSNYNNKTYLIENDRYWRYNEDTSTMDRGYPKEMSAWRKLPYPIDAGLIWQGDTFFFRGPRFWRFDNHLIEAHEYYPLPTAQIWFPCPNTPEMGTYSENDEP